MPKRTIYVSKENNEIPSEEADREEFAKILSKHLHSRGWSQSECARQAQNLAPEGVDFGRHLVCNWLAGRNMPSPLRLSILARALKVPEAELMPAGVTIVGSPVKSMIDEAGALSFTSTGRARVKLDVELPTEVAMQIISLAQQGLDKH